MPVGAKRENKLDAVGGHSQPGRGWWQSDTTGCVFKVVTWIRTKMMDNAPYILLALGGVCQSRLLTPKQRQWMRRIECLVMVYLAYRRRRDLINFILRISMRAPIVDSTQMRTTFMRQPLVFTGVPKEHTHGDAANDRTQAEAFTDILAPLMGLVPYYTQMSKTDQLQGRQGSREWFWVKDLTAETREFKLPPRTLEVIVDVDQYMDMPAYLSACTHPVLIYTFQPNVAARETKDYSFTFEADNQVRYLVNGGGIYRHHVWNYSYDHILAVATCLGIPYRATAFLVDRRATSLDRELVMLTPIGTWTWMAPLVRYGLYSHSLRRLEPVRDGFVRLQSSNDGLKTSTAEVGQFAVATLDSKDDQALSIIASESKYPLTLAQVEARLPPGKGAAAPVLLKYHRHIRGFVPPLVCPLPLSVRRYQFDPAQFDPGAKPMLQAFMNPIINDAFAPDLTQPNERQAVKGRIEDVRPPELKCTKFMMKCMNEFAELLLPTAHQLVPLDEEVVLDRQDRPAQRRILEESQGARPRRVIQAFMKKEPYANVKDPRIISTINGPDKRAYSCYTYAFEPVLKAFPWYAFGRVPKDTAARVAFICHAAEAIVNTDFSRFDGHGSNIMRMMERLVLLRAFRSEFHAHLVELHSAQYGLRGYMTSGVKFDIGFARTSGSPDTSLFNSMFNAFIAYFAFRLMKYSPVEAFASLGIYGGDDGLTADVNAGKYAKAAEMVGQKLTLEPVLRGQLGVKFLARIYGPGVWYGDDNSMCDVARQLRKLHVTVALPPTVTPSDKLFEKLHSFSLSDSETPILGPLCEAGRRLSHGRSLNPLTAVLRRWDYDENKENQYPNVAADWMLDAVQRQLPEARVDVFAKWLSEVKTFEGLLTPPTLLQQAEAKPETIVVIEDEIHDPSCHSKGAIVAALMEEEGLEEDRCYDDPDVTSGPVDGPPVGMRWAARQ